MRFIRPIFILSILALVAGCESSLSKDKDRQSALDDPMNYGPDAHDMIEDNPNEPFPTVTNGKDWETDEEGLKRDLKAVFGD